MGDRPGVMPLTSPDSRRSFGSSNSCRVAKANTAMPPVPYKLYWYGSGGEILAETDSSGTNGEIQVLTQKRGKIAIIPLSTELKSALEEAYSKRKPRPDDLVLLNPENGEPFVSRKRLYERCKALGSRAGIKRRSEEHTSELQSHHDLVCRLLLEKKKSSTEDQTRHGR